MEDVSPAAVAAPAAPATAGTVLRAGIGYGFAIGVGTLLAALFQFATARVLDPADYSLLATLLVVIMVVGVPLSAIQASVAHDVATSRAAGGRAAAGRALRRNTRAVLRALPPAVVLGLVLGVPAAIVLGVHRYVPLVGLAITLVCCLLLPLVWGGLQGETRFRELAWAQVVYAGLKLLLGVALGALGAGVAGVMLGIAGSSVAILVAVALLLRPVWNAGEADPDEPLPRPSGYGVRAAIALAAITALTASDVVAARFAFSPHVAGVYAAVAVGARSLLLIATAVTTVLFPHVATLADPRRERKHLLAGVAAVAGVSLPLLLAFRLWGRGLLELAFGGDYASGEDWLAPLGVSMALYAVATVYLYHWLSLAQTRKALVAVPVLAVQTGLYVVLHDRPLQLVAVQIACAAALVVVSEVADRSANVYSV
jgi:O-antigen/teichoic acid export membrane protein